MSKPDAATGASEWRSNWTLVLAAMVGYSMATVHTSSIGVMMEPIEQDLGWSRTQIYSGVSLVSIVNMVLATFMGLTIDRFGPRLVAIVTSGILMGGIALMSTTSDDMWGWWLRWVIVGIGLSAMPTVWITAVTGRFSAARGLAVSVALSGSGIGTFLAPVLSHALVEEYGWRNGFAGLAAIWSIVVFPLILLFFRAKPTGALARQSAKKEASASNGQLPGLTALEGLSSPTFWKLLLAGSGAILGGVAIILNLVPVLTSTGLTRGSAATVASLVGISTIVGRIVGGWMTDRFSAKWIAAVATIGACALPIALLGFPGSVALAAAAVIVYGLMGGAKIGALVYLASRHLGQRAFGTLYGAINASIALVVAIAPLAANYIYDLTRNYEPVMWAAVPILFASALLYATLGEYPDYGKDASG